MSKTRSLITIIIVSVLAAALGVLLGFSSFWFNVQGSPTARVTVEQLSVPYWFNTDGSQTTIYDEIVTPIKYGDSTSAVGYLAYTPSQIISVQGYDGTTYDSSMYTISGNQISFNVGNGMPYVQNEWLDNKNVPSQYNDGSLVSAAYNDRGGTNGGAHVVAENALTRTTYLAVTYKYDSSTQDLGFTPQSFQPQNYPNLLKKLNAGQPVKILIFGDSISVGASASAFSGFPPYTPTWFDQIKNFLVARYYGGDASKVTIVNPSVGGTTSAWGVKQSLQSAFDKNDYDLIIVGFGMNDGSAQNNPAIFKSNISQIITDLRVYSPHADFIILGTFTPNPKSVFAGNHSSFIAPMQELAEQFNITTGEYQSGCTCISMYEISTALLAKKQANNNVGDTRYQYMDISANYTNHPNDFMVRLYAGSILSSFIDFSN